VSITSSSIAEIDPDLAGSQYHIKGTTHAICEEYDGKANGPALPCGQQSLSSLELYGRSQQMIIIITLILFALTIAFGGREKLASSTVLGTFLFPVFVTAGMMVLSVPSGQKNAWEWSIGVGIVVAVFAWPLAALLWLGFREVRQKAKHPNKNQQTTERLSDQERIDAFLKEANLGEH
jgi:hypothetical protein